MNAIPPNRLARPLALGMIALAVFAVGAAIYVTGSPMQQRRERIDERRVEALEHLATETRGYAGSHQWRLPASLDALERPGLRLERRDPVTDAPYEYRLLDAETFELCATFESDTSRQRHVQYDTDWVHGAGRQCFRRQLDKRGTSAQPLLDLPDPKLESGG